MSSVSSRSLHQLYQQDYALWIEAIGVQLKARDTESLDWENLIEEIEDLGKSQRRELENRLEVLLAHLLKRLYVALPECYRGWQATIQKQRNALKRLFKQSPSLRNHYSQVFEEIFQDARSILREEYPDVQLPEWQFNRDLEAVLSQDFWQPGTN